MEINYKLGVAKIDITPLKPVPLAGFESRQGVFDEIRHALHARIFFLNKVRRLMRKDECCSFPPI